MLVGRALASVGAIVDLKLAVVGGSVALGFSNVFFEAAQDELDKRARLGVHQRLPGAAGGARVSGRRSSVRRHSSDVRATTDAKSPGSDVTTDG